jgi:DNA-binding IclR family transcriptional regulator
VDLPTKVFAAICRAKPAVSARRFLKGLRLHGLARKIPRTSRYRLSLCGQTVIALAFKLKDARKTQDLTR